MSEELETKLKKQEREITILKKKLGRSEKNRAIIEESKDRFDNLYQTIIQELDEQKALLNQREQEFRLLLESAPDATIIVDEDGLIKMVNHQAEELFGFSREELLEQKIDMLIPEQFHERHDGYRQQFMKQRLTRPMVSEPGKCLYAAIKDGREIPIEVSLSSIETESGIIVYCAIRDITKRREVEEELRQQMEELQRLARLTVNREGRMIQLKEMINDLLVKSGQVPKYKIVE